MRDFDDLLKELTENAVEDKIIEPIVNHLKSKPDLYVTVRYKEQLGCPLRRYYIDTKVYSNETRTKLLYSLQNDTITFYGDANDFTLPPACRK